MISKDYHSAWLNSAALAAAGGDLDVARRRRRARRGRRADGHPARGVRLALPRPLRAHDRGRVGRGDARRDQARALARRRRDPRQGRLARRARDLPAPARRGQPLAAGLGLDPARAARRRGCALAPLRLRRRVPADRLPQVLHGRHARLADRAPDGRHRRRDHEPRGARGDRPPRAPSAAGRSACTRSATRRTGTRSTRSRRRGTLWEPQGPAAADRARPVPDGGGSPPLRRARDRVLGPVLARSLRPRPRRAPLGRTGSTAPTRSARCSTPARWSRTAPTRRSRSSTRSPGSPPACSGRSTSGRPGGRRRR